MKNKALKCIFYMFTICVAFFYGMHTESKLVKYTNIPVSDISCMYRNNDGYWVLELNDYENINDDSHNRSYENVSQEINMRYVDMTETETEVTYYMENGISFTCNK